MINKIWFILISIGIVFGFINNRDMSDVILNSSSECYKMIITLGPLIVLWSGLMNIAEKSNLLYKFSLLLKPFFRKLFPTVKNDKALLYISSNVAANMLGLGSAATPAGLNAMKELDKENNNTGVASDAMITFLVLNTSGVTLIPISVIALRMMHNSINPTNIILPSIIATICSTICGLTLDYFIRRKNVK